MEINQFVAVTDNPEFCLGTTLLYIDTHDTVSQVVKIAQFSHMRMTVDKIIGIHAVYNERREIRAYSSTLVILYLLFAYE